MSYSRNLVIDLPPGQSAFLWGARQTGKSTLLRERFPDSFHIDLLDSDQALNLSARPARLGETLARQNSETLALPVIIDEIQKVPGLLDEVHRLIETRGLSFILCGSSARRLRRTGVNLLGGRAWRFELFPLVLPVRRRRRQPCLPALAEERGRRGIRPRLRALHPARTHRRPKLSRTRPRHGILAHQEWTRSGIRPWRRRSRR